MTPEATRRQETSGARARRAALLAAVRGHRAGVSIYGLAQQLGRPYRRVFETVRRLAAAGDLSVEPELRNNRRATLVSLAPPVRRPSFDLPAHLSDLERIALRAVAARLARLDRRIVSLHLFGSRARGASRWDSDFDLAIRVRGQRDAALERKVVAAIADLEWGAPLEGALRLSPLVLFEKERRGPLEAAIDAQGVVAWRANG